MAPNSPRAEVGANQGGPDGPTDITPGTYNGAQHGGARFASPGTLLTGAHTFTVPTDLGQDDHALGGDWDVADEYVESGGPGAVIAIHYRAGSVNLVLATASGQPIDATVQVDDRAPTTVTVTASDLYNLVADSGVGSHTLRITAPAAGLRAYAFTFGG